MSKDEAIHEATRPGIEMKPQETTMKKYQIQYAVGSVKYAVSYHDGKKTHNDGSPFFDIKLFKNKRKMESFVRDLEQQGYGQ